jgi:tetratricopeptide (TPR) repeat protein
MTAAARPVARRLDPDELAALEEQRDFLLSSLDDLEREHVAGDIDESDYRTLRDDYTTRTAEVLRAIDERRQAFTDARRPRSTGRIVVIVAGVLVFAVLSGVLVAQALGGRAPGQTTAGDVRQTPSQDAKKCISVISPGKDPRPALKCFQNVLKRDPQNPVALAYQGWTINLTAMAPGFTAAQARQFRADAARFVRQAIKADPGYSDALAFAAIIAFQQGKAADAQRALRALDRSRPPPDIKALIKQFDLRGRIATALRNQQKKGG